MKTLSKTSKGFMKNELSDKETNEASDSFIKSKRPLLSIQEVLKLEKKRNFQIK